MGALSVKTFKLLTSLFLLVNVTIISLWIFGSLLSLNAPALYNASWRSTSSPHSRVNVRDLAQRKLVKDVRPYIFEAFSPEILSYFASCDAKRAYNNKNALTSLGAHYFTADSLHQSQWFNAREVDNIHDANIIIVPFQFTLALTGRCGRSSSPEDNIMEFEQHFSSILDTLGAFKYTFYGKGVLLILHHYKWIWYHHDDLRSYLKAQWPAMFFVGHFENRDVGHFANYTNTVVLPYTIPIALTQYQEYNDMNQDSLWMDFQNRPYSLFFMGTVCKFKKPNHYETRIKALKYMLDPQISELNPFGIGRSQTNGSCHKIGLTQSIPICLANATLEFPCLFSSEAHQLNKHNKLYIEGMKRSKFNLMLHGDTPTSGKFYDSIAFNMINIFVGITRQNMRNYLPFVDHVPYESFAFFIDPQEFNVHTLRNLVTNNTEQQIKEMLGNLSLYKRDILWNMERSRVVKNVILEAYNKLQSNQTH